MASNTNSGRVGLLTSLIALTSLLPSLHKTNPMVSHIKEKKKSKKTGSKRNNKHVEGSHFKPVYLFTDELGRPLTPAAYRRLHLGRKSQRKIHERKSSK